ncbi:hypothetical protein Z945_170 [Sulfitobacter noctilucae]|nr:hypothetical protein Z945_170 [Sulfitobacter noctilucae]
MTAGQFTLVKTLVGGHLGLPRKSCPYRNSRAGPLLQGKAAML